MKITIRLTPIGDGRWHWSLGRGGMEAGHGNADSHGEAQSAAEDAAQKYAEEVQRAQSYLFDTTTHERIGFMHEEG